MQLIRVDSICNNVIVIVQYLKHFYSTIIQLLEVCCQSHISLFGGKDVWLDYSFITPAVITTESRNILLRHFYQKSEEKVSMWHVSSSMLSLTCFFHIPCSSFSNLNRAVETKESSFWKLDAGAWHQAAARPLHRFFQPSLNVWSSYPWITRLCALTSYTSARENPFLSILGACARVSLCVLSVCEPSGSRLCRFCSHVVYVNSYLWIIKEWKWRDHSH